MRVVVTALVLILPPVPVAHAQVPAAGSCESLTSLPLPNTQVARAQTVPAGRFAGTPAGVLAEGARPFLPYSALPSFCRVAATLTPSSDSDIKMEVWMPVSGWNGKFLALGNGGWAGQISVQALARALGRGYATATTDTGHAERDGSFAFNHPEKLIDFSYRAVHEMTVRAKAFVGAYYGRAPTGSYWEGCSTGGRQGLKEAQRYPADYDGIIAGAPANDMTHMLAQSLWVAHATLTDPARFIPPAKYPAIHAAAIDACDRLDGVVDGVIGDPTRCRFDPGTIQCDADDDTSCLTAPQVDAARMIYAPATNSRTGAEIFPGSLSKLLGDRARPNRCRAGHQWHGRSHSSVVSVSSGRYVPGNRKHERRGQFRLSRALTAIEMGST